uniref:Uncharacterized protein n=1 Tax=Magallana gigas TaxID=29159 RepID=K1P7K5_MAGGI
MPVSSTNYRKEQKAKVKAKELRGKKKEDLEKQLDDLKQVGHNYLNKNYSPFQ